MSPVHTWGSHDQRKGLQRRGLLRADRWPDVLTVHRGVVALLPTRIGGRSTAEGRRGRRNAAPPEACAEAGLKFHTGPPPGPGQGISPRTPAPSRPTARRAARASTPTAARRSTGAQVSARFASLLANVTCRGRSFSAPLLGTTDGRRRSGRAHSKAPVSKQIQCVSVLGSRHVLLYIQRAHPPVESCAADTEAVRRSQLVTPGGTQRKDDRSTLGAFPLAEMGGTRTGAVTLG